MHKHQQASLSPYSTLQLFNIVADIESYTEFIPWITSAKILKTVDDDTIEAELIIEFKSLKISYISRVTMQNPGDGNHTGSIDVLQIKGPFRHLVNKWRFTPDENGSVINFDIEFSFKSRLLEKTAGFLMEKTSARMTYLFEKRAESLYGNDNRII